MEKRNELVSQGPAVYSSQRHLSSRDRQVGKGSCREWSLGIGVFDRAVSGCGCSEASEAHRQFLGFCANSWVEEAWEMASRHGRW